MTLNIAIQMDPIASIDIGGDTSFALGLEAQKRGHNLWYYTPDHLNYNRGCIDATGQNLTLYDDPNHFFDIGPIQKRDLAELDIILMRQDPPFDMAYITATHLLEMLPPSTMVVNNPAEVRNAPEKLFVTAFHDLIPPTLISRDPKAIKAFRDDYKDIIIKPLFGNGGAGVFHLRPHDQNLNALLELFFGQNREPVIIQKYLPEIGDGDKRIILIDGQQVGAINRLPAAGEARSNLHVGGTAVAASLTARDTEICASIGPELSRRGLVFAGIDIIGDYLTEINVTSPTGLRELSAFSGTNIAAQFWDRIEEIHPHWHSNGIQNYPLSTPNKKNRR